MMRRTDVTRSKAKIAKSNYRKVDRIAAANSLKALEILFSGMKKSLAENDNTQRELGAGDTGENQTRGAT